MKFKSEISYIQRLLKETKIKEIMTVPVIKIYDYETLSRAEELFVQHSLYYLPVVNRFDELVGVITHKYLYKTVAPRKVTNDYIGFSKDMVVDGNSYYDRSTLDSYKLKDIMNPQPKTLGPEDSVAEAVLIMASQNTGCIPIIKGNKKVCGIMTHKDIVSLAALILLEKQQ
ncbi:MAG: CBS domain-containing protein [Candidatus Omnitrophica bacterium]|nr:CBS domain-containing protein [Candidatus Omnitrophota bacterium]